jgi:hypothetical protein
MKRILLLTTLALAILGGTTAQAQSGGAPVWTNLYDGPGNYYDVAYAMAVDGSGNVFVTGFSPGSDGYTDYATIKYSGAGVALWTNRYNGPGNTADAANAIAVDGSGNVFVTGYATGIGSGSDYATVRYSFIPPSIHFQRMTNQLVLTWANPAFSLQSAPAVTGTFTNIPGATSPYTKLIAGSKRYFRLKEN